MCNRPGVTADGELAEGGVTGAPTNQSVKFTGVNSCVTVSIFYDDGTVSAGHFGMFEAYSFQNPDEIVRKLKQEEQGKTIQSLLVVGETGTWAENWGNFHKGSQHNSVGEILKALNPNRKTERMVDTAKYTGGKTARIEVLPTGVVIIKDEAGHELHRES